MARIVASLVLALGIVSFGFSKEWIRVRVQVDGPKAAQRVADSPLTLFDCRISVPFTDLAVGPHQTRDLLALGLPFQLVEILPDPYGWENHAQVRNPDYRFNYLTQDQLMNLYDSWAAESPQFVVKQQIATSHNGEPIFAYRLRTPFSGPDHPNRVQRYVLVGGMHAREWISHATVAHIFRRYLDALQNPATAAPINLGKVELIIVPNLNPDGYRHSWTTFRLWRKNRRNNGSSFGVDLNRNFATGWGGQGSSGNPSSDTYRGPSAFSEPETAGLRNLMQSLGKVSGFIDFHSYGELILHAWGYTNQPCPHHKELNSLGIQLQQSIFQTSGLNYTVQRASQLYIAGGCSDDWAYSTFGTKSYTIELRDKSTFILPESQIAPTQDEAWQAVRTFISSNFFLVKK